MPINRTTLLALADAIEADFTARPSFRHGPGANVGRGTAIAPNADATLREGLAEASDEEIAGEEWQAEWAAIAHDWLTIAQRHGFSAIAAACAALTAEAR